MKAEDIQWICFTCGNKYGMSGDGIHTVHLGKCSVCKESGIPVSGARNYRPYDSEKLKEVK